VSVNFDDALTTKSHFARFGGTSGCTKLLAAASRRGVVVASRLSDERRIASQNPEQNWNTLPVAPICRLVLTSSHHYYYFDLVLRRDYAYMNQDRYNGFLAAVSKYGFGISSSSSIPLYYQLYLILQRGIRDHELAPGERFPAEEAIGDHFSVSRPTANRAVQELIKQGWLVRQRGRGTFVKKAVPTQLSLLSNALSLADEIGKPDGYQSQFVTRRSIESSRDDAAALQIEEGEEICYMRRLHTLGERVIMVCDSKLPLKRFPGLETATFVNGSLFETLRTTYSCHIRQAERCAEAAEILDIEVAELLGVPLFAPIMLLNGLAFDDDLRPIEAMTAYVREGISFKNLIVAGSSQKGDPQNKICPRTHSPTSEAC